jgi:hypothetical protein
MTGALPWESDEFPFVFYASGGLVSVRMQGYEFTGGAHGNHAFEARNFAWVNNALVELAAKDVIAPSHYKELRELCIKDLRSQHASWPEQIGVNKETPPILNVTAQALVVTFPPYEAGSYAEGAYTVCLPFAAVAGLMPAESPVKSLAK